MAPNPSKGIELPVVNGYPAAGAGPTHVAPDECCSFRKKSTWLGIAVGLVFFCLIVYEGSKEDWPRFHLDSVSVHVNTTAVWDIGFSIDRPVGDLEVWARFMDQDFVAESSGSKGNATVSLTTTVPPGGIVTSLDRVVFKCNNYKDVHRYVLKAVCKDVAAGVSEIDRGVMIMNGGPRVCPVVYNDLIR